MICKKCRKGKHWKCKNGMWAVGTWCDCQHRVDTSPGWALFLANKYGGGGDTIALPKGGYLRSVEVTCDSGYPSRASS